MNLSRHLYEKEEIKASYIVSLLKKQDVEEAYFWICELFYSFGEEETIQHILKIYYDLYHITNHNMKEWLLSQEITEQNLLTITKNFFLSEFSLDVFNWRVFYESKPVPTVIYRRISKKFDKYSKKAKKVINAIEKRDLENVCGYLVYCSRDEGIILDEIVNHVCPKQEVWCRYTNKFHILLSEIVYYLRDKNETNKNYVIEEKEYNFNFIDFSDLSLTRIYKIQCEYIGCFELPRVNLGLSVDDIYKKWDVYCFNTPFWNEKFKEYNGKLINNGVVFDTDEQEELFYEHYGYGIDEYPSRSNEENCFCEIKESNDNLFSMFNI
tara:strand:+ start:22 stop:993 length:972 start_codon:yes stop_codon:yes gene_type:complete